MPAVEPRRLEVIPAIARAQIASELRHERWGGIVLSHNGVWRCLRRHGLNTRAKQLSLVAGYAAPYKPPREPEPEGHFEGSGRASSSAWTASSSAGCPGQRARSGS